MLYSVTSPYYQYFLSASKKQRTKAFSTRNDAKNSAYVDTSVKMQNNDWDWLNLSKCIHLIYTLLFLTIPIFTCIIVSFKSPIYSQ